MSGYLTANHVGVDYGLTMPILQSGIAYIPSSAFNPVSISTDKISYKNHVGISDVKILSPNKVVQVIFTDGTSEKAVCSKNDTFSLETGITVCIAKKLLGGTKEYNKIIRNALKTIEKKERLKKIY